jgi:hypothetical protein
MRRASLLILCLILVLIATAQAEERPGVLHQIDLSGFIAGELQVFPEGPQFDDQLDHYQPSLIFEPEVSYDSQSRRHQFNFIPFARLDGQDDERTHFDIREAYWRYVGTEWELLVGLNRVFFGVAESRHLVNIINQIDRVEDIDEEDFLGQPMINIATQRDWGRVDLYLMSGFRKRTFPGPEGRLRTALPVDEDSAEFESDLDEGQPDFLTRYSHFIGDWDIGIYHFYGTGREPVLLPAADGTEFKPRYEVINQAGVDLQLTREATLYKFEGIIREGQGRTFGALVAGVEHTFFQIYESEADLGILAEYLLDDRDDDAPVTFQDNDLFLGTRLSLNDIQDTSALLGVVTDLENSSTTLRLEAARRIGDRWKIEFESQWFFNIDDTDPLTNFKEDSFFTLRLSRFL